MIMRGRQFQPGRERSPSAMAMQRCRKEHETFHGDTKGPRRYQRISLATFKERGMQSTAMRVVGTQTAKQLPTVGFGYEGDPRHCKGPKRLMDPECSKPLDRDSN